MWTAIAQAITEFFRFIILWESPDAKRQRQRTAMQTALARLMKERDALLAVTTPTLAEQARMAVVLAELQRVRTALADLAARQ